MKIQRIVILSVILFFAFPVYSQVVFKGNVVDEDNIPLEMANVIAYKKPDNTIFSFTTSNKKGEFVLKLESNNEYLIKVSYVGMRMVEIPIVIKEEAVEKKVLMTANNMLEEVNVVHTMPVSIKGDTIVYDADSFTTGNEKKLENVLEKLPGVEIGDNGEVKVEGKKVKKVMVEGKDFFEGDTKLATQNIPANAVDKVEVLRNHNDIGQLRNITDNEDNVALNIKLKEGKKKFWFGDIDLTAGLDERYLAHPNLFYYSPKYSLNIIGDANNLGKQSFTWQDYFKFMGGFKSLSTNSTVKSSSDLNFLTMQNEKAKSSKNTFGATNFNYTPNDNWSISGFAIYSDTKTAFQNEVTKNYYKGGVSQTFAENIDYIATQKNKLGIAKFQTTYIPNVNNQLDYDFVAKFSDFNENSTANSSIEDDIFTKNENKPKSIFHNLSYYFTLNNKNIFALQTQYSSNREHPFYNSIIKDLPFADTLQLHKHQQFFNINQFKEITTTKLESQLNYYYILNSKGNLTLSIGFNQTDQKFNAEIQQILDNNSTITVNQRSNINYKLDDNFAGIGVRFLAGKFTVYPEIIYHQFAKYDNQLTEDKDLVLHEILPSLSVKYKLKKGENLNFSYNKKVEFSDISNVVEGYVLNGYNALFSGNKRIVHSKKHQFTLSYFNFDTFNFSTYSAFVNYSKNIGTVRQKIERINLFTVSSPINSAFSDDFLTGVFSFHKSYQYFKWSLNANLNYIKYYNAVSDTQNNKSLAYQDVKTTSFTHSYETKMISNLKGFFNFDIGYGITINQYQNSRYKQKYIRHSPLAKVDIIFLKDFRLQSDFTYNLYQDKEQIINRYSFWNSRLLFQKQNSKWEFSVSCTNILNTVSLNTNSGNELYHSVGAYFIQPRYVVLGINYHL